MECQSIWLVIGAWRREVLEQQCFSFTPGDLLVELPHSKRKQNLCFIPKHVCNHLLHFLCHRSIGEREKIFAQQNGYSCSLFKLLSLGPGSGQRWVSGNRWEISSQVNSPPASDCWGILSLYERAPSPVLLSSFFTLQPAQVSRLQSANSLQHAVYPFYPASGLPLGCVAFLACSAGYTPVCDGSSSLLSSTWPPLFSFEQVTGIYYCKAGVSKYTTHETGSVTNCHFLLLMRWKLYVCLS